MPGASIRRGRNSARRPAGSCLFKSLMAAGDVGHPAVKRGIDYLSQMQAADGLWPEQHYTAVGFPRIFYLRYHGYAKFFPLWALARYRNLKNANSTSVAYG